MHRVVLFAVNHNSPEASLKFLDSLRHSGLLPHVQVLIVDSASSDDSVSQIKGSIAGMANCQLLALKQNRGYFGSAREGLEDFLGQSCRPPDWIIVCNNDVTIQDADFITKLAEYDPTKVGVIAPRVVSSSGAEQNPFMEHRPPWWRRITLRAAFSTYPSAVIWDWLSRQKAKLRAGVTPLANMDRKTIYAPHGSFLIFSRQYFAAGGFLDANLFLYGEEICVAEICRSLKLPVVFEPRLLVYHNAHQSIGRQISRFSFECQKRALKHISASYWN